MPSNEYFAGWFDGEGCIRIAPLRQKNGSFHYSLHVSVNQTYSPILHIAKERFGGTVVRAWAPEGRKPISGWQIQGPTAARFLEAVYPFLHEKRQQAWLALEFRSLCFNHGSSRLTPELRALGEGFYVALAVAKRDTVAEQAMV